MIFRCARTLLPGASDRSLLGEDLLEDAHLGDIEGAGIHLFLELIEPNMELNGLLLAGNVDLTFTLVLRHQPTEQELRRALPLLAGDRLDLFNAYQSYQSPTAERSFEARIGGWVASFIAYGPAKAIFVGLYKIEGASLEDDAHFWSHNENKELAKLGLGNLSTATGETLSLRFDLRLTTFHEEWRGKLVVNWPPPERSWVRRAHKNVIPVWAIREESFFSAKPPPWNEINFTWAELAILPQSMRVILEQWRGVYLIWDSADGKSYVGSAYGGTNILGRWESYAATGHGGNKYLRGRDPSTFRFTILELVSPNRPSEEVVRLESLWKRRLHTAFPSGLNDN